MLAAAVCLLPTIAAADVHDGAGIFGRPAADAADAAMQKMDVTYHKQFTVETFKTVPDDLKAELQSKGKEAFFNDWLHARARALGVNGVYALVCMDPPRLEVEAGKNTLSRGEFTHADLVSLREGLQSAFKAKDYDRGLRDAVDQVDRAYTTNIPGQQPAQRQATRSPAAAPVPSGSSNSSRTKTPSGIGGFSVASLICLGLGVIIVVALVRALFGSRNNNRGNYGGGGGPTNYGVGGPTYGPGQGPGYGGGGGGYGPAQGGGGGGGFGRGLLGGLLGGAAGGYVENRLEHRNDPANTGGGFAGGSSDAGTSGGDFGGGGFDSGPSDAGQVGDSSGGDFGGGGGDSGGGDSGGGGGDSGGGSSGGDF